MNRHHIQHLTSNYLQYLVYTQHLSRPPPPPIVAFERIRCDPKKKARIRVSNRFAKYGTISIIFEDKWRNSFFFQIEVKPSFSLLKGRLTLARITKNISISFDIIPAIPFCCIFHAYFGYLFHFYLSPFIEQCRYQKVPLDISWSTTLDKGLMTEIKINPQIRHEMNKMELP